MAWTPLCLEAEASETILFPNLGVLDLPSKPLPGFGSIGQNYTRFICVLSILKS
jgi:hypothetical protein